MNDISINNCKSENTTDNEFAIIHKLKNLMRKQKLILDELTMSCNKSKPLDIKLFEDMDSAFNDLEKNWKIYKELLKKNNV
ncbi:MAG: hypothetical protein HQK50_01205 [Oligoflexia bacterium]|nr:hypothetical protein [Oligoflexia bacterium]